MKKKTAVCLSIILCIPVLYLLYLDISSGSAGLDMLKLPLIYISLVCQLLGSAFSEKRTFDLPAEIKEDEDFVLATDRLNYGRKMWIAGGLMVVVPVILLLIFKSLHGFWARAAIFSFLIGIPVAVIGLILSIMGSQYVLKSEAKHMADASVLPESESKISGICSLISAIASIAFLVVILID